jgi:hypothetical protein
VYRRCFAERLELLRLEEVLPVWGAFVAIVGVTSEFFASP